ncbi:hypothetical protein FRX31_009266, partial [Thalictrum thalictroides]
MLQNGYSGDNYTFPILLKAASQVPHFFDEMTNPDPQRNVASWNTILCGYLQIGLHSDVIDLFTELCETIDAEQGLSDFSQCLTLSFSMLQNTALVAAWEPVGLPYYVILVFCNFISINDSSKHLKRLQGLNMTIGANKGSEQIKQVYIDKKGKGTKGGSNLRRSPHGGHSGAA